MQLNYNYKGKEIPCVSFDFHDCMTLPHWNNKTKEWETTFNPNPVIIDEIYRYKCNEWKVYVVIGELQSRKANANVGWFLITNELKDVVDSNPIFCGTYDKHLLLKNVPNLLIHYDDDPYELEQLPPHMMGVLVPFPKK